MTGFELLEQLEDVPRWFSTAYDEFALKAFEVNALDYLLKPIAPERLAAAVRKVHSRSEPARLSGCLCGRGAVLDRFGRGHFLLESEGIIRGCFWRGRPLILRSWVIGRAARSAVFFRAGAEADAEFEMVERVDPGLATIS